MGHILQHKSAPVKFDPPVTDESIARAKAEADKERAELKRLAQLAEEDKLELSAIVDRHGWRMVAFWLSGVLAIQDGRNI